MSFARPEILLFLVVAVPAAAILLARAARKRREALEIFHGAGRPPAVARGTVRSVALTLALALVGIALAGPRAGTAVTEARRGGLDLVVALDVSASMTATDVPPDRLDRARFAVERLAESRPADRLALVVFSGTAVLLSPLTRDAGAFRLYLDAAGPEIVGSAGSEPARAMEVAASAFDSRESTRPRAILLVTDGENPNVEERDQDAEFVAGALAREGISVLALAVGTGEGSTIPLPGGRLKRDALGAIVRTRVDREALQQLAGEDVFGVAAVDLARLDERLDQLAGASATIERVPTAAERYQWPLALGLAMIVLERLLAYRAGRRTARAGRPVREAPLPVAQPALA